MNDNEIEGLGNDYTFIQNKLDNLIRYGIIYNKSVSIVLPVYNRKIILEKTLAALTHQTYPKKLIEVIVADDGSDDNVEQDIIQKYKHLLQLCYVRQEHKGYRPGAARNLGIKIAKNDYIILLDCDMLPVPNLVEEHMKYFHVTDNIVTIGHRRFVNSDELTADMIRENINLAISLPDIVTANEIVRYGQKKTPTVDWRMKIYNETDMLKKDQLPFRVFCSGNVAFKKEYGIKAGLFDESFTKWGNEDGEFGFRLYKLGLYFLPVLTAVGLHQEHPIDKNRKSRTEDNIETIKLRDEKVPLVRKYEKDRLHEVPKISIFIVSCNVEKFIKECVESVMNQTYTDFEICIYDNGSTDNTVDVLISNYSDNPRVKWTVNKHSSIDHAVFSAIKMCRGIYIGGINAQEVLEPNALEEMVTCLDENQNVGVVFSIKEKINKDGFFIYPQSSYNATENNRMFNGYFSIFNVRYWNRVVFLNNDTTDESVDYSFNRLKKVCDVKKIDKILCKSRVSDIFEPESSEIKYVQRDIVKRKNDSSETKPGVEISVIICTHNRAYHLKKAIDSLLKQSISFDKYEIIVVDNCSTDNTKDVIDEFISKGHDIVYCFEPKIGLSHARNKGVRKANAEYLIFLDDDTIACPDLIKLYLNSFKNTKPTPTCIAGRIFLQFEVSKPSWFPNMAGFERSLTYLNYGETEKILDFKNFEYPFGANMGILKSEILKLSGFDENLGRKGNRLLSGEETKIFFDLYNQGKIIYYLPNAYVYHTVTKERMTKKFFFRRYYWYGITLAIFRPDYYKNPPDTIFENVEGIFRSIFRYLKSNNEKERFLKICDICSYFGFIIGKIRKKYYH